MSHNTFGHLFRVTTWGESHGTAIGCVVDGAPPLIPLAEPDIQQWLDRRRPGQSRYVSQRREPDTVEIVSGVFDGLTSGTPINLVIANVDARSKDYGDIKDRYRPGHADFTYEQKYGVRDWRGSGRASARETAARVAAGAVARKVLGEKITIRGAMVQMGPHAIDRERWDWAAVEENPFWCPDPETAGAWGTFLDSVRKNGSSTGAIVEVIASGVPAGFGAPLYGKLDADLAAAMMSINAVKGVEIGAGFGAAALSGEENADEMRMRPAQASVSVQQCRRRIGRNFDRAGCRRTICRQADVQHFHPPPNGRHTRAECRCCDHRASRSLCRDTRRSPSGKP